MIRLYSYYAAVFLSAFLLFQVQPMISKALLPLFGGSYLVWGACMVFFQAALLLGYVYAHAMQRRLGVARYARLHWLLLALPFLCFPFRFDALGVSGTPSGPLAFAVVRLLVAAVGLPFFTLSTTSLLLQRWLARSGLPQARNPYVLYSASNLGSMLALISYPVLVEPLLDLNTQGYVWWGCYLLMAFLHIFCFPRELSQSRRGHGEHRDESPRSPRLSERPSPHSTFNIRHSAFATWFLLSAAACALLLGVTNVITFDVASVPFLWVLPLSVYLLSFVLAFKRRTWFPAWAAKILGWAVMLGMLLHLTAQLRLSPPAWAAVLLHVGVLFVVCLNCIARLVGLRPGDDEHLTTFYIAVAAGGLAGSLLVSWIMPVVSTSLMEYPLALVLACTAVAMGAHRADREGRARRLAEPRGCDDAGVATARPAAPPYLAVLWPLVAAASLTLVPWCVVRFSGGETDPNLLLLFIGVPLALALRGASRTHWRTALALLAATVAMNWTGQIATGVTSAARLRNFYGVYRVFDKDGVRYLQHGTTQHGRQYLDGVKREVPLAYFHPSTPAAGVLSSPDLEFARIGMVGLGTGALATYAGDGQEFVIYELDPDNLDVAREHFSYLDIAERRGASLRFVFGDGRVALQSEPKERFDLFIIDAFNSGSIPVHLLTVDALREYLRVLGPEGLLLMHISNRALDLEPVVVSNARELGVAVCSKSNEDNVDPDAEATHWMALSASADVIGRLADRHAWNMPDPGARLPRPWTDRYSNVLGAMMRHRR